MDLPPPHPNTHLFWSTNALQCCVSTCCITWISCVYTYTPSHWSLPLPSHPTPPLLIIKEYQDELLGLFSSFLSSVQSLSCVWLFATPWTAERQASLAITNSRTSLKLTSIELVMPSSQLILCRPLLLLPPIPPSIKVFSNKSTLHMRWPKYWNFSFSIIPSKEHPGLISFRMDWLALASK